MGNEFISMLKNTSLLSVIAVLEIYTVATQISAQNLKQIELLIVVSLWYLLLTSLLAIPSTTSRSTSVGAFREPLKSGRRRRVRRTTKQVRHRSPTPGRRRASDE